MKAKLLFLSFARSLGLFWLFRRLTSRRLRIICYHGGCIGDEKYFNPKLFTSADLLKSRLNWLLSHGFQPVSLNDAVDRLASNVPMPKLPVVITLDDGWYSSARDLLPVLARKGFPATLYLATAAFESGTPILDVTIGYALWKAGPKKVCILGLDDHLDGEYDLAVADVRRALLVAALQWVKRSGAHAPDRRRALERFAGAIGLEANALALDSRRFSYMNAAELRLASQRGCSIELHGHVHSYPAGRPDEFRRDIEMCRDSIRRLGLPEPTHYCYPMGDFDAHAPALLSGLGVRSATVCNRGLVSVRRSSSTFFLPRLLDGESVSKLEFEAELSGFTQLLRFITGRRFNPPSVPLD